MSSNAIRLLEWRRRISEIYASIRRASTPEENRRTWRAFRFVRDQLFAHHPLSPLSQRLRRSFEGLEYFDYDPQLRLTGTLDTEVEPDETEVDLGADGSLRYRRVARARFILSGRPLQLSLYWLEGYGGGLFLPFRDETAPNDTYGGGRYLFDSIKGADLGTAGSTINLDFNYAYNPSCSYNDPQSAELDRLWTCPLAPRENFMPVEIPAGEKRFCVEAR